MDLLVDILKYHRTCYERLFSTITILVVLYIHSISILLFPFIKKKKKKDLYPLINRDRAVTM